MADKEESEAPSFQINRFSASAGSALIKEAPCLPPVVRLTPWDVTHLTYRFENFTQQLPKETIRLIIRKCYDQWQEYSGLTITEITSGTANISIGFYKGKHGGAYHPDFDGKGNVLADAWAAYSGFLHFDDDEEWDETFLTGIALHETGHTLGLEHGHDSDAVMWCTYTLSNHKTTLRQEDKLRIGELYGPYAPFLSSHKGIGGFDLSSTDDKAFALDYYNTGRADTICLYRPGRGAFFIVGRDGEGHWKSIYAQGQGGTGIGGFDLSDSRDKAFALDFEGTGRLTHICLYRPGTGICFIIGHDAAGNWTPVYDSRKSNNQGIGGFDLSDSADQGFALDFKGAGKVNHICFYRPGSGIVYIIRHISGQSWQAVYPFSTRVGQGIGGYDLSDPADRAFAFDYDGSGKLDHICLYRPGKGAFSITAYAGPQEWKAVYEERPGGKGIGGFDLTNGNDQITTLDRKTLFCYRPGSGVAFIVAHKNGKFESIYRQGQGGSGIGGYDMDSGHDRAFALDLEIDDKLPLNQLVLYRPGSGTIYILKKRKWKD